MPPKKNKKRRVRRRKQFRQSNTSSHSSSVEFVLPDGLIGSFFTIEEEINLLADKFDDAVDLDPNLDKLIAHETCLEDQFFILGEGSFGLVTLGNLRKPDGSSEKVALKGANNFRHVKILRDEASIMANFDHLNVVKLVAVQKRPFKIVMEYMVHGDLLDALKNHVFSKATDLKDVLLQVASGMEYISGKNYIHRDLACRNIFIDQKKQCKVGDFGLCKYVGDTDGVYDMKGEQFINDYCAPEVMDTDKFTTKCDVWSMGLLVWELYMSASGMPNFFKRVLLDLFTYTRELQKPKLCPVELYFYTMNVLLNEDPKKRPPFSTVKEDLQRIRIK